MRIEQDFKEFIASLNRNSVRYLIVGGYAFSFHAEPRFTKDIDFFLEASDENVEKLLQSLAEFGFGNIGLSKDDFLKQGDIVQLGVPPVRIDLINSATGIEFSEAWENRVTGNYGGIPAFFISKADLIRNKAAVGRKQDSSVIEKLQKIWRKRSFSLKVVEK